MDTTPVPTASRRFALAFCGAGEVEGALFFVGAAAGAWDVEAAFFFVGRGTAVTCADVGDAAACSGVGAEDDSGVAAGGAGSCETLGPGDAPATGRGEV